MRIIGEEMSDILKEASSTFNELVRMHELNQELLETLMVAMQWIRGYAEKNNIPFPNQNTFFSLLRKAESLINEMMSNSPPFLQHRKRTPEDATEPLYKTATIPSLSKPPDGPLTEAFHFSFCEVYAV